MSPEQADELVRAAGEARHALTAEDVLRAASDPQSPLHDYFQWDAPDADIDAE